MGCPARPANDDSEMLLAVDRLVKGVAMVTSRSESFHFWNFGKVFSPMLKQNRDNMVVPSTIKVHRQVPSCARVCAAR